jgi:hypothetical protein
MFLLRKHHFSPKFSTVLIGYDVTLYGYGTGKKRVEKEALILQNSFCLPVIHVLLRKRDKHTFSDQWDICSRKGKTKVYSEHRHEREQLWSRARERYCKENRMWEKFWRMNRSPGKRKLKIFFLHFSLTQNPWCNIGIE